MRSGACNEIQVNNAIRFDEGKTGRLSPEMKTSFSLKELIMTRMRSGLSGGALVPKDARFERHWETKKVRSTCSYCGVGCQIDFHVKDNRIVEITGAENRAQLRQPVRQRALRF
ncbi:MAG: hypothetical protein R2874_09395 [Desulfobacterales bacterium]